jgi:hypothetical protein
MTDRFRDIVKAREELVAQGMVRDSGRRRNGEIVWEITEKGVTAVEAVLADYAAAEKATKQ